VHIDWSQQQLRSLESTMKIGHHAHHHEVNSTTNGTTNGTTAATGTSAATDTTAATATDTTSAIPETAAASAKIQLSHAASTLLKSGSTPEFDAEKVSRIQAAIKDGTYKINADAIADKLLSNAHEVLNKARSE
jgi:negative regulator of flagellin synthesis FlgM